MCLHMCMCHGNKSMPVYDGNSDIYKIFIGISKHKTFAVPLSTRTTLCVYVHVCVCAQYMHHMELNWFLEVYKCVTLENRPCATAETCIEHYAPPKTLMSHSMHAIVWRNSRFMLFNLWR